MRTEVITIKDSKILAEWVEYCTQNGISITDSKNYSKWLEIFNEVYYDKKTNFIDNVYEVKDNKEFIIRVK